MVSKWETVKVYPSKIRNIFHSATPEQHQNGLLWYLIGYAKCNSIASNFGLNQNTVAGIVAALSPSCPWERNVEEAKRMVENLFFEKRGEIVEIINHTTYPKNVEKARRILNGEDPALVLGGKKVKSFYTLLTNPSDCHTVCLDRHAVRSATIFDWKNDSEHSSFLKTQYDRCADAYRKVAKELNLLPNQVQAVCWEVQRST